MLRHLDLSKKRCRFCAEHFITQSWPPTLTGMGKGSDKLPWISERHFFCKKRYHHEFAQLFSEQLLGTDRFRTTGPRTRQILSQEAMTTFLENVKVMIIGRNWPHIGLYRLRIKRFESQRCYQSNGTSPDPQNYNIKFKIE